MADLEVEDTLRDSVKFADKQAQRIAELENQLAEMEYTAGACVRVRVRVRVCERERERMCALYSPTVTPLANGQV